MIYIFWKKRIKNQTDESRVQILCIETFMFSTSYVYKKHLKVKSKYIDIGCDGQTPSLQNKVTQNAKQNWNAVYKHFLPYLFLIAEN